MIVMKMVIKNGNNKVLTLLEELCKVRDIHEHAPARPPVTRSVTYQGPQLLSFYIHYGGGINHQNGRLPVKTGRRRGSEAGGAPIRADCGFWTPPQSC